jgi:hypothetical protein
MTNPTTIRLTAGLIYFERANCADCQTRCALHTSADNYGVNADELHTIGQGVCPYHPNKDIIPRARHGTGVLDTKNPEMRDGIVLTMRIVQKLSGSR